MKRDWPKIYFLLILILLFLSAFITAGIWNINIMKDDRLKGIGECRVRGLEYYKLEGADCIDYEGRLYKVSDMQFRPWYVNGIMIFSAIIPLIISGFCIVKIIEEYKEESK